MLRIGLARVTGLSMIPTLAPGDLLFIRHISPESYVLRLGQIVVAKLGQNYHIKRIAQLSAQGVELAGDNREVSTDSRDYGEVATADVLAVAVFRVWPKPSRLQ